MKKENLNTINTSGFKVPKNYFEGLEDAILTQTLLETHTKVSGFKTPENYFDTLDSAILSKIDKPEPKVFNLFSKKTILSISSAAAAIVLLFNLNLFKTTPTLDALDTVTVENYILDEIEINDLNLLIGDSELSQTDFITYDLIEIDDYIDDIDLNDLYQD
ncbi:hypothetical protein [Psychroserpens sp. NJDZ02]|uniref:hypothetical protein n=1 Tax=Psychroserpens sp. NJDZ02 TaxID=2570561 RepID=UPI0010A865E7|nr:hypothetical protein [Psychroserpens sp. NJDZ02]QCE42210.1 hypothetical protein E9099_12620 [Psychroserpens sp. NJDZ02]